MDLGRRSSRVVVVGAGVGGLAAAIRLGERGHDVTVIDPAPVVGGLAGGFRLGGSSVERYYHHVFRSDTVAQKWITDLGLGGRLEFRPATMGFYAGGCLHSFGTPASLLRFPLLSPRDRIRLGLRIRELASEPTPAPYEHLPAVEWLRHRASLAEMRVFWMPLLRAKFGRDAEKVSMAWLWARFRARVGGPTLGRERLGYLRGGFQQLGDRMAERVRELGADIRLKTRVEGIDVVDGAVTTVRTSDGVITPDAVVWTPSLNALARLVPDLPTPLRDSYAGIVYHSAVVMVVELARSVLPCYWVTIGDSSLPFTVAVEHTRFIPAGDYGGRTIVYLGRYAPADDPVMLQDEEVIRKQFLDAAAVAFDPMFRAPLASHLFRAPGAQPIVPPGWSDSRPPLRSGIAGLVLANMAQIYPWDRGVNYSLELGEEAAAATLEELGSGSRIDLSGEPQPVDVRHAQVSSLRS
jgi:protoporphyrinogen oxidase